MASSSGSSTKCCSVCGEDGGIKACSLCLCAHYCGVKCQKADLPSHRAACTKAATTRLISAVASGDVEKVQRLAKTKRVVNGKVDYSGHGGRELKMWTALHECVRSEKPDLMKLLIENGADVDIEDADGETPLFIASTSRTPAIVQALIYAGANTNAIAGDGWSCLMMAAREGDYDVIKLLLEEGASQSAAADMFGRTAPDIVNLLKSGQGIGVREGETIPEKKVEYGRIHALLSAHADVNHCR